MKDGCCFIRSGGLSCSGDPSRFSRFHKKLIIPIGIN